MFANRKTKKTEKTYLFLESKGEIFRNTVDMRKLRTSFPLVSEEQFTQQSSQRELGSQYPFSR